MKKDVNIFQLIFIAIFVFFIVAALILFSIQKGGGSAANVPTTVVWGTISQADFGAAQAILQTDKTVRISYVQRDPGTFNADLVAAIANGTGPDAVIIPDSSLWAQENLLAPISYQSYPVRTFKDTFVQEGELYLGSEGIYALPLTIDPLVMYWNRDIFNNAGMVKPPSTWEAFLSLGPALTKKDPNNNILQSAVALGDFKNVAHAKEILSALLMQSGASIVTQSGAGYSDDLSSNPNSISVVTFYTQFANPLNQAYSWNSSLPLSTDYFTANNLALYFGFGSELNAIRDKNPNLNYDVAAFPQLKDASVKVTFGRMEGISVLRSSRNFGQSILAAEKIASAPVLAALSKAMNLPPARRDLLAQMPADPYLSLFYTSAVQSRTWLDPDPAQTDLIFGTMVSSVISGVAQPVSAISNADQQLTQLLTR